MRHLELNKEEFAFLQKSEIEKVKYSFKLSNIKRILIASALCGEGKTTIGLNVCLSLAEDGEKILYIGQKSRFIGGNTENDGEISNSGTENFDIMLTDNLKAVCVREYQDYDRVFIESPALEISTEGIFLADHSDAVLLVVETNRAGYRQLREARDWLTEGRCKELRIVLNRVKKNYGVLKRKKLRRD